MIGAIFAWLGARRWALELIGAVAIAGALLWYHHHVYTAGIAAQRTADAAARAQLEAAAAHRTQALEDLATQAEHAHDTELAQLRAYRDRHPVESVRLCLDAHGGPGSMPEASAAHASDETAGAPAARVQPVPDRDSGVRPGQPGPDVGSLLGALAARADEVSAQLREWQAREASP